MNELSSSLDNMGPALPKASKTGTSQGGHGSEMLQAQEASRVFRLEINALRKHTGIWGGGGETETENEKMNKRTNE